MPEIKAFDILEEICLGLSEIIELVSLAVDLLCTAIAAIPVIGMIVILLGLVFSVISMILKSTKNRLQQQSNILFPKL